MATKRGRGEMEEFEDIGSVSSPRAKVSGVVSSMSPMKKTKTCSYFDAKITDGKASMRLYGYDSGVRRKIIEGGSGASISLSNCEIKKSRMGDQLEVCQCDVC